jgi:hypothetical protein
VTTTALDAWADSEGWPSIELVKIDVEGGEGAVLPGMTELLERNPGIVVVLEFQADALEAAGEDPVDFLRRLLGVGGRRVELLDERGNRTLEQCENLTKLVRRSRWSPLNLAMWNVGATGSPRPS